MPRAPSDRLVASDFQVSRLIFGSEVLHLPVFSDRLASSGLQVFGIGVVHLAFCFRESYFRVHDEFHV